MNLGYQAEDNFHPQIQQVNPTKTKYRYQSKLSKPWWRNWTIPLSCSLSTIFGTGIAIYPTLLLMPISGLLLWLVAYEIKILQSFTKKRWLLSAFAILLALGATWGAVMDVTQPANAAFSFLFADTETTLKNCVLKSITAAAVLAGVIFGGLRVAFMIGIGVAGYQIWTNRQQGQDYHDTLQIVLTAILIVSIIGVIEPLIVGPNGCTS